ncbi:LytR/AlgR family response regulator transcription factor [Dyella sp. 2RAB6]|uniref:LytR/AlgR family response regulator transcription factor n=1 Tax=Dyella sp. 2RAB6 TaxID=3232992 RepID=UPI003F8D9346
MIRALIVDDEPLARRGVRVCLRRAEDIQIAGEADSGQSALELIRSLRPELVFLDVQMPGMDGFEMLSRLAPGELPLVVFLTAYDAYALEAFRVHALDYLMKPIDDDRFDEALRIARHRLQQQRAGVEVDKLLRLLQAGAASGDTWLTRFEARQGGQTVWVPADQVDWIEASGDYVILHVGPRLHMLHASMDGIEQRLDPARFARIHRSAIVALDRVRKFGLLPTRDALLTLADGTELRVSRRFRHRLRLEHIGMLGPSS